LTKTTSTYIIFMVYSSCAGWRESKFYKGEKIEMKKEIQLDANGKRKFGMLDKVAYAAGDLGCNMSFGLKATVQTF